MIIVSRRLLGRVSLLIQRVSYDERGGPAIDIEVVALDHSVTRSSEGLRALRRHDLLIGPLELGLVVFGLCMGGLISGGATRYALFSLGWLLVAFVFVEILSAILALMTSGAAVVGLFGGIDFESFLAFNGFMLAGCAAVVGAVGGFVICTELLRYLWRYRFHTARFQRGLRGRRSPVFRQRRSTAVAARRLPSLSQYIVGLAVDRLPATLSNEERQRWEEEMRADVEETFPLIRIIYALAIWLRGAPAMPEGTEDAPQSKPYRG